MSIEDYVSAQQKNLESIKKLPHFSSLGQLVNDLYELACRLVPRNLPPHYGKFLLLCHKSFLSALTLIGQAQPEDAAAITRRAIEMARLALAVKTNQENATNWLAFEKRMARWRDREEDIKPKTFSPKYDLPKDHLVMNALEKHLGILSDSYIHFTPEFFGNQDWIHSNTGIKLEYFTSDQRTIERELIALTGIHASILRILDECFDRALFASSDWTRLWDTLHRDGVKLAEPFAPSNSPAPPHDTSFE